MNLFHLLPCLLITILFPVLTTQQIFSNVPPAYQDRMETAFHDMIAVATLVAVVFSSCQPALLRYFQPDEAELVRRVFCRIANIDPDVSLSINDFQNVLQGRTTLDPRLTNLLINYGNHPEGLEQYCGGSEDADGFFTRLFSGRPCVCICPKTFYQYPDFSEIENPPAWATDAQGHLLPGYGRDGLGTVDSDLMWFPGAVLLHEVIHVPELFNDIPQWNQLIQVHDGMARITDYTGTSPPNGYGPFYARVINLMSQTNLQPAGFGVHETVNNADNYVAFALNIWWQWRNQKVYGEAVNANANWRDPPPRPAAGAPPKARL